MQIIQNGDGTATWKADPGFDLAVSEQPWEDIPGTYVSRRKEAYVPADGGLNKWVEVPEFDPVLEPDSAPEETPEQKIARLEAELAALKAQTN